MSRFDQALLIAGADEPFAESGDSTALGLLYTAILLAALVAAGNGLRWCVEWLRGEERGHRADRRRRLGDAPRLDRDDGDHRRLLPRLDGDRRSPS